MSKLTVTTEVVQRVLDDNPDLSAHGLRPPRNRSWDFDLARDRAYLLDDRGLDEIQRCVDWFSTAKLSARVYEDGPSSYGVKHMVEAGPPVHYVSNGAAIVAAILCGVPMRDDGGPNPLLGINRRWYNAEHERVRPV